MSLRRSFVGTIFFCFYSALVQAEMYLTVTPLDDVIVGDHRQSGVGFDATRRIVGGGVILADPSRIQVYTGTEQDPVLGGSARSSRLLVCVRNILWMFDLDAAGDLIDNRHTGLTWTGDAESCDDFIVHRGNYFLKVDSGGDFVEVYPFAPLSSIRSEPARVLIDDSGPDFFSLKADGSFLYALTGFDDVIRWNLDSDSEFRDQDFLIERGAGCPGPWGTHEVHEGLIYVTSGTAPDTAICVYDSSNASLLRILSHPDVQDPSQLSISGDELFVVDGTGIYTFDIGAGGPVPPKRVIETGEVNYIWVTQQSEPVAPTFALTLEEPVDGAVHSGVGNLRGWAVASEGVSKVDIFVDGVLFQSAPYGGSRADVGGVFPDVADSGASGFSLAFNYGALGAGEHTILARAETGTGEIAETSSTFTVAVPGQEFIPGADAVDLSGASCSIYQGRSIRVEDITIDGSGPWDALLKWQPAAQAFEAQTYIFDNDAI